VLVELVLLIPLYLLILFGAYYLTRARLIQGNGYFASRYAGFEPGSQDESGTPGVISEAFYPNYEGTLYVSEDLLAGLVYDLDDDNDTREIPIDEEIRRMLEDWTEEDVRPWARGEYVIEGGQLVFRIITGVSISMPWQGQYVINQRLLEDSVPELTEGQLQEWMWRNRVRVRYVYGPTGMIEAVLTMPVAPGEPEGEEDWNVTVETIFQAAVRGEKTRELELSSGTSYHHAIESFTPQFNDGPGTEPHYPDFGGAREFDQPN